MSNLEAEPAELEADCEAAGADAAAPLLVLEPREVPLGGPRAMTVLRTLPQRRRSTIGAWCFLDHYGPDDVSSTGGMQVPPHPHTGLQTVSWLFQGEIEHRDSVGSRALVRPGELNLMTAGHGISHTEYSTPGTTVLHGAQLWTVLPDAARDRAPFFEHTVPAPFRLAAGTRTGTEEATAYVFIGALKDHPEHTARATVFSKLLGAQLTLPAGTALELAVEEGFEHGVLVDLGAVEVEGSPLARTELGYLEPGRRCIRITAVEASRILLLGGEPIHEQIVMWWNFIGRSHDEIVVARARWTAEAIVGTEAPDRFGRIDGSPDPALAAPALPTVRLKPREQ